MSRSSVVAALALLLGLGATISVSAHRLDEYLQAARIGLELDGVLIELDLTPGVAIADSVMTTIDRNRDGLLSADEQTEYAREVVRTLELKVDDIRRPLELISSDFPAISAFPRGEGTIRLRARASHPALSAGPHLLLFRNTHLEDRAVYLANALVPDSPRIAVAGQRRDGKQSQLMIDYSVESGSARFAATRQAVSLAGVLMLVFGSLLVVRQTGAIRFTHTESTSRTAPRAPR